ncbi:hypothetical protein [Azospirillum sp. TSO35-2]|uniref:hypothetical protein n=1 Tax=Azospirillum sp. TSO35-2 TaxID=716796 RepID=UPI0013049460|nr:hypothetical protein [Azospirillum sp. TSO35-2]
MDAAPFQSSPLPLFHSHREGMRHISHSGGRCWTFAFRKSKKIRSGGKFSFSTSAELFTTVDDPFKASANRPDRSGAELLFPEKFTIPFRLDYGPASGVRLAERPTRPDVEFQELQTENPLSSCWRPDRRTAPSMDPPQCHRR